MLTIYGRLTSINVRKVVWLADETGLAYDRQDWGMPIRDPRVPEFLALNPNGQVPVIVDDGFVLWESHAILRYLAGMAQSDLWPSAPTERARVDQWMSWQSTELNPAWSYAVGALLRGTPPNPDPARVAESVAGWRAKMLVVDTALAGQAFIANGRFSLADIVLALSFHRFFSLFPDETGFAACRAHRDSMQMRPAGMACLGASTP